MTSAYDDIHPMHLAAIVYAPDDDVDTLLADFADALLRDGTALGGVVQRNRKDADGRIIGMALTDLQTGTEISIGQQLGAASTACKLDPAGLVAAAVAVSRAAASDVALIIVNKFSKQEATGHGLRSELAEAILSGRPLLTAVPEKYLGAWDAFTGHRGATLRCAPDVVRQWWQAVAARSGANAISRI